MTSTTSSALHALIATCLESVTRGPTEADRAGAVCDLFEKCLPLLLEEHADLLTDYPDLERAVSVGLPVALCARVAGLVEHETVTRLYPAPARAYISRAAELLSYRLDSTAGLVLPIRNETPSNDAEARLLVWLDDVVRGFAAGVLIGGPPPKPTTSAERRAAREWRLAAWQTVRRIQDLPDTFSALCRAAGVRRIGRGSGAFWLNGALPDAAKTSKAIEAALSFKQK